MYEDVGAQEPFDNLQNWDTLDAIAYLCGHREELPRAVDIACRLNRWVEDQFLIFGPSPADPRSYIHPPSVMEQYICSYPMEVHSARWIEALLALHAATGDSSYRVKAVRAANAIVRAQRPEGRFSTWGIDTRTGQSLSSEGDWYGCNAVAGTCLLKMT
jgi:hypothetical protein